MARRVFVEVTHSHDLSDTEQKAQVANIHSELDTMDIGDVVIVQGSKGWAVLVGADSDIDKAVERIGETQFAADTNVLTDDGAAARQLDTQYMVAACDCQYP